MPAYTEQCISAIKGTNTLILFTDSFSFINNKLKRFTLNQLVKKGILGFFYFSQKSIGGLRRKKLLLSLGNPICCPSVMFNKSQIGPFEFCSDFHYAVDWDAWERLTRKNGNFCYINKPLMIHRIHSGSELVKAGTSSLRVMEDYMIYKRFWPEALAKFLAYMCVYLSKQSVSK